MRACRLKMENIRLDIMSTNNLAKNDETRFYKVLRTQIRQLLVRHDLQGHEQQRDSSELDHTELELLAKPLRRHVDNFTSKRADKSPGPMQGQVQSRLQKDPDLAAYLAYYSVRSFALARQFTKNFQLDPRQVLDIGSGPASAGLACILGHEQAQLDLLEPSKLAVLSAMQLAKNLKLNAAKQIAQRIENSKLSAGRYSTVLIFFSLNEWPDDEKMRVNWLRQAYQSLAPGGQLLIVEPALRKTSRELMSLREQLIAAGLELVAPCTHHQACPMLQRRRDYCHGTIQLDIPDDFVRLGEMAGGLNLNDTDYAYLLFRASGLAHDNIHEGAHNSNTDVENEAVKSYRVVGNLRKEKGRLRQFVCGAQGLVELSALTRAKAKGAKALQDLQRGDEIALNHAPEQGRLRLQEDADVQKLGWRL